MQATLETLIANAPKLRGTRIMWAKRSIRWDVYPAQQPTQLIAHNWEGFFAPTPDGRWFKTPSSYDLQVEAKATDAGSWKAEQVTERVQLHHFVRA